MKLKEIIQKFGLKKKLSLFIYGIFVNAPVAICLSTTSTIIANAHVVDGTLNIYWDAIEWNMHAINVSIAFAIAMCVTLFVPLIPIGKWFTALFHVDNITFTGNPKYRFLATTIYSLIFFLAITPTLNILNCYIFPLIRGLEPCTFKEGMKNLGINTPFMLIIGYISSILFDIPAYQIAHKIDEEF